jgi:hypothetical protein
MQVRVFAIFAVAAACLATGLVSCRRESTEPAAATTQPAASAVSPVRVVDTNLLAAGALRAKAERTWRESDPSAEAAFKRLADAEAAYTALLGKFGLYAIPAAESQSALNALAEAREKGDTARVAEAEKAMRDANARAEQAEAVLRSGNPPIQAAFDEWAAARQAYSDLRERSPEILKAEENMTRVMEKGAPLESDRKDRSKEIPK